MPSKGRRQRNTLDGGLKQANDLVGKGVNAFQPFVDAGRGALNQLSGLTGQGTPDQQAAARAQFEASPFYQGGAFDYEKQNRELKAGFGEGGTLFSTAFANADRRAARDTYSNAFQQFLGTVGGLANTGFSGASGLANLFNQQGANAFNTASQKAGTFKGLTQKLSDTASAVGSIGQLAGQAAGFFSDERLKSNIEPIGYRGPLTLYKWEWNDKAKALGLEGPSSGFMADEVARVMPEAVGERSGYATVNYEAVLERFPQ